jgi:zinc protease
MSKIRTQAGQTYGISSQLSFHRHNGIFLISTTTRNAELNSVLSGIMNVYTDCIENGITAEELQKAKQFALGNLAFQLEGIGSVAEKLLWLRFFGYDNSRIENHNEIIESLTVEKVNSALKQVLSGTSFVMTAVGRKEEIQNVLEKYGIVRVVNYRSNP